VSRSPYELSTPSEVLAGLHPRLRAYFGPVPPGHVGRGEGVFSVVGTPRRWVWPVLALFARDAVMFPVWAHDVPFTVENRPVRVGRGLRSGREARSAPGSAGHVAVRARRTFHFASGGRLSALLAVTVPTTGADAGALRLVSTRVTVRALGRGWSLPAVVSPRVTLTERFDDEADVQRVSLVLSAPVVGTLYRYEGAFRYAVVPDDGPGRGGQHGGGHRG
jgi:hypothetical protein